MRLSSLASSALHARLWRYFSKFDAHTSAIVNQNVDQILNRFRGKKNGIFIDCGVNEGYILEKYTNGLKHFKFYGFEIQQEALQRAAKRCPNAKLYNKAAMSFNGQSEFYIPRNFGPFVGEGASFVKSKFSKGEKLKCVSIECINFIDFLVQIRDQFEDVFVVVKMDIEGSEYNIINSLYDRFNEDKVKLIDYLMIEFHPKILTDVHDNSYGKKLENMNIEYTEWI